MSEARRLRRQHERDHQDCITTLAVLCGDFYEFLSKSPQPSNEEVRAQFTKQNDKWLKYCRIHKLMNIDHLFKLNVREAWTRHASKPTAQSVTQ